MFRMGKKNIKLDYDSNRITIIQCVDGIDLGEISGIADDYLWVFAYFVGDSNDAHVLVGLPTEGYTMSFLAGVSLKTVKK